MVFKNDPYVQSAVGTSRSTVCTFCMERSILDPSDVESQYRKILGHMWAEEKVFRKGRTPSDAVTFWVGVSKYKDGMGRNSHKELSICTLAYLSTPVSNAVVERMFSYIACIKMKARKQAHS